MSEMDDELRPEYDLKKLLKGGVRGKYARSKIALDASYGDIVKFCQRWKIVEFALFGSILREDFNENSDVDVLVSFDPQAPWGLFELVQMKEELAEIFGREVDLVEKEGLRNPYRIKTIMNSRKVIYDALGA